MAVMRRPREREQEGFTLLEVLIAMTIMGVGILAIGLAQLSSMKMSSKSRSLQQAMYLAQEQLDFFMSLPANHTDLTTPVVEFADPAGAINAFEEDPEDGVAYTRTWTVEPNTPSAGLSRITIFVNWDSAHISTQRIELQGIRRVGS